ncbi:hypothetical protein [Bifidobacterium polysaccharolyticum]|uniref:hypothetical protein n=1 Tax=Bifidobacterium polysaccharolyticum TaxID=2750967 RepID=UPI00210050FF
MARLDILALVLPSVFPLLVLASLLSLLAFFFEATFVPTDDFGIPVKARPES